VRWKTSWAGLVHGHERVECRTYTNIPCADPHYLLVHAHSAVCLYPLSGSCLFVHSFVLVCACSCSHLRSFVLIHVCLSACLRSSCHLFVPTQLYWSLAPVCVFVRACSCLFTLVWAPLSVSNTQLVHITYNEETHLCNMHYQPR
jgi:hypothetical protein